MEWKDWITWIIEALFLINLIILSVFDVKGLHIPIWGLIVQAFMALLAVAVNFPFRKEAVISILIGVVPGLLLLIVSFATRKVGVGDGIVLAIIGIATNYLSSVTALCIASFLIAVLSIVLLLLKKINRNSKLPFIPFLAAGFVFSKFLI